MKQWTVFRMKLSIIIPYYETFYLTEQLLKKLRKQIEQRQDIEIILINDGSNGKELASYADTYISFKINRGVSCARNVAISIAQGDYICFIDSDDDISDDYVDTIIKKIDNGPFDLCWISWDSLLGQAIVTSTEQPNIAVWGCIFNANIIKTAKFDETYNVNEEFYFWNQIFQKPNRKIDFIPKIIYYYNIREGSLIRRFNNKEIKERRT